MNFRLYRSSEAITCTFSFICVLQIHESRVVELTAKRRTSEKLEMAGPRSRSRPLFLHATALSDAEYVVYVDALYDVLELDDTAPVGGVGGGSEGGAVDGRGAGNAFGWAARCTGVDAWSVQGCARC